MKKIILLLLALLLLFGCGSDQKKTESEKSAEDSLSEEIPNNFVAAEVEADEAFDLSYIYPNNKKIRYKLTSIATSNQKITADSTVENNISQTTEYFFLLESKIQDEQTTNFDLTVESISMNANYNGDIIKYDSKQLNDEETNQRFAEYSALPNVKFTAKINTQGRILEIGNTDGIVDRYLEIQQAQSITAEEKSQLKSQLIEQVLQPMTQNLFKYMPGKETKVDSSWTLTYGTEMGLYKLTNSAKSKLTGIVKENDNLIAKINTDLNVSYQGDGFIKQGDVSYQFEQPKISGNAITYFNLAEKVIVKSELTTKTEMNVFVTANNPNVGIETATRNDLSVNRNYLELISIE